MSDTIIKQCEICGINIDVILGYDKNIYPSGEGKYLCDDCKEKEGFKN